MSDQWTKEVNSSSNFRFDFAPLENGNGDSNYLDRTSSPVETILSFVITADSGITVESSSITHNGTSVTVKISGGTAGEKYKVVCLATTNYQTEEEYAVLRVT